MNYSFSSDQYVASSSSHSLARSQIDVLDRTSVMTDPYTLMDVLAKLKDQVRMMAARVSKLDQYVNFVKNPVHSVEPQEMLKLKQNVINGLTNLVENTRPLSYPCYQSLSSAKLLETFEKVSSECLLLLNNIKQDNENIIKSTDRLKNLSIHMKDFQQEAEKILSENIISAEIEKAVALDFKECRSDMYTLLSQLDPSSKLKQIMSLLVECNNQDEHAWVNIEDMPDFVSQCYLLKKKGFVLQNEQNKNLFKLNF